MFTGLIDDIGSIDAVSSTAAGRTFVVRCGYQDVRPGESIAVNGACLTVRECGPGWFEVAAIVTTIGRTTLGGWAVGRRVNLERSLRVGDRFGGHIVQGHVDAVGRVRAVVDRADARLLDIDGPGEVMELLVPHGSVCVDGVSLTVNELPTADTFQVSLIEYTRRHTTLGTLAAGDAVHLEADVVGKYVRQLTAPYLISDR